MKLRAKVAIAIAALLASHYAALVVGTRGAIGRSAYVDSVAVQLEEKCWSTKDIECYRASWHLRAATAAASAKASLHSPVPSGVDRELEEYLGWYEKLAPYEHPAK